MSDPEKMPPYSRAEVMKAAIPPYSGEEVMQDLNKYLLDLLTEVKPESKYQ